MKTILFAAALSALPLTAVAQVAPVAPPYHPAIDNPQVSQAFARIAALQDAAFRMQRFEEDSDNFSQVQMMAAWRAAHNPRRVRRANAAAELINGGDCDGTLALAQRERDERLARRIEQVCTDIAVSTPVPAAAAR